MFDLATPLEAFGRARLPDGRPAYRLSVCSVAPLINAGPMSILTERGLDDLTHDDTIVVPGAMTSISPTPADLDDFLAKEAGQHVLDAVEAGHHRVAGRSPCAGIDRDPAYPTQRDCEGCPAGPQRRDGDVGMQVAFGSEIRWTLARRARRTVE